MKDFLYNFASEIRAVFTDVGVLIVMVGAVVFYSFVYPLPYSRGVLTEVDAAVVDLDRSALSRTLIRMADASQQVKISFHPADRTEAEALVARGLASGILIIPKNFERDVKRGRKAHVGIYADAAFFLVYRQVMTGLIAATRTLSAGIEIKRLRAAGTPEGAAEISSTPLYFAGRPLFNPTMGYAVYIVPAVLTLLLQQTLLIGLGMMGGTRRERGFPAPRPRPRGGPGLVVISRAAACLAIYLIHVIFIFGVIFKVWNLPLNVDLPEVILFLLPFLLASIMLGQALAGLFHTRESAIQVLVFTSLLAVLLSGFSWPPDLMPTWINALARLLPSTNGIDGLLRLGRMGADFRLVGKEWVGLWVLALVYAVPAYLTARRADRE